MNFNRPSKKIEFYFDRNLIEEVVCLNGNLELIFLEFFKNGIVANFECIVDTVFYLTEDIFSLDGGNVSEYISY